MNISDTYRYMTFGIYASAALVFIVLFFMTAPYGRHYREGWGFTVPAKIGWIVMETPAVVVFFLCFIAGGRFDPLSLTFLAMWEAHYIQRTYIYPLRMRGGEKRFPVLLVFMAIVFNAANAYANGTWLYALSDPYPANWFMDVRFVTGLTLFALGYWMNRTADGTLRSLREAGDDYRMPAGGAFELVSCPNYTGEILQWFGWALATWSAAGLAFAVFTAANLVPRAHAHHSWYREKFPDYPKSRKRVIPFLY